MSDPTPEEIATLIRWAQDDAMTLGWQKKHHRLIAVALASLQRRAETAERERDALQDSMKADGAAGPDDWVPQPALAHTLARAGAAESRLADQAKVIEAISLSDAELRARLDARQHGEVAAWQFVSDVRDALSQLAEKGGNKT